MSKINILIVDDEVVTLKLTKQGLEKLGFNVAIFSRPQEALEYFEQSNGNLDLVISDKSMPLMNGKDLLKRIREKDANIPVFILTGYSSEEDDSELSRLGVTRILYKPLSIKELQSEILSIFEGPTGH